jgi:hypothetical protein
MASNNFQQWNPNCNNQEDDPTYAADAQRTGGASSPSLFASVLANKFFFQLGIFLKAFMDMMVDKGFSPNDGSASPSTALVNLKTILANILTTADVLPAVQLVFRATGIDPHSGTTTNDTIYNTTVPSRLLNIISVLRFRVRVAVTTANPVTLTLNVGGVALSTIAISHVAGGATDVIWEIRLAGSFSSGYIDATILANSATLGISAPVSLPGGVDFSASPTLLLQAQSSTTGDSQTFYVAQLEVA